MKKHYFLGQAASFRVKKTFRFLFSFGTRQDFDELKQDLAEKYQVKKSQVYLFHSGRTAITLALLSQIPKESKQDSKNLKDQPAVVITSLTCFAVVQAVKTAGYQPVFLDIDPKTLHFNAATLEKALKKYPNIQAVIVQNNLGLPCDMKNIQAVAKAHKLFLIEDLAHSLDIEYSDGCAAGSLGDAVILSFGKGKSLDASSGGALILRKTSKNQLLSDPQIGSSRPKLSDSLRDRFYPFFGLLSRTLSYLPAGKYNLGQCLMGVLVKLNFVHRSADAELDFYHRMTYWQAKYIRQELKNFHVPRGILRVPYFVQDQRKTLHKLQKAGFYFDEVWYDTPVAPKRHFNKSGFNPADCPVATVVAKHLVNLPVCYSMQELSLARQIIYQDEVNIKLDKKMQPQITKIEQPTQKPSQSTSWQDDWTLAIKKFELANFLQSPKWQKFNELLGRKTLHQTISNEAQVLMVVRDAKRGRFLEISNGPLLDWSNTELVNLVFSEIYQAAKIFNCVFIRFRPAIEDTAENRAYIQKTGAIKASFHLNAEHTVMIDLTKTEEELLADFRRQTRYEVRRAEKLKIKVIDETNSPDIIQEFHNVQLQTAKRQNFIPPTLRELEALKQSFGNDFKIYTAYDVENNAIAYGLILIDGKEADYYEAASTPLNRKLPGAYALQWQVMRDLKKLGIKRYNLWGIAPEGQTNHRYSGVTTFKTGFSGERFTYVCAQDIPIRKFRYRLNRIIESLRKKHRHLS